jgi:ABC-2 type transport system permease protein
MLRKQWIALKTIVYVEIARFMRVWLQSLMPPVITIVLYFLVFGHFIGPRLQNAYGVPYMQFIVPGLVMMAIVMSAYNNTAFSFFMVRFQRSIEEILVSPVNKNTLLLGFTIGGMARGLLTGLIVICASFIFTHSLPKHIFIVCLSALLASLFFSLAGFTNAIFSNKFDDISTVPTFILTPLIYLGGVFYSISQLPPLWQTLSYFNPITYIVSIFRYGFLGIESTNLIYSVLTLVILIVMLYCYNFYLLNKGVGIRT